jgi:hypothetical protein
VNQGASWDQDFNQCVVYTRTKASLTGKVVCEKPTRKAYCDREGGYWSIHQDQCFWDKISIKEAKLLSLLRGESEGGKEQAKPRNLAVECDLEGHRWSYAQDRCLWGENQVSKLKSYLPPARERCEAISGRIWYQLTSRCFLDKKSFKEAVFQN